MNDANSSSPVMKRILIIATLVGLTACGTTQAASPAKPEAPATTEAPTTTVSPDPVIAAMDADWATIRDDVCETLTEVDNNPVFTEADVQSLHQSAVEGYFARDTIEGVVPKNAVTEAHMRQLHLECPDTPVSTEAPSEARSDSSDYTLADFSVELITLESSCYGSAGGLVTVEPDVFVTGGSYPGAATLVYEIHGGESVETQSIEIDGDNITYKKKMLQTASCNAVLTAVPVNLIER